jgi:hypothetical protein
VVEFLNAIRALLTLVITALIGFKWSPSLDLLQGICYLSFALALDDGTAVPRFDRPIHLLGRLRASPLKQSGLRLHVESDDTNSDLCRLHLFLTLAFLLQAAVFGCNSSVDFLEEAHPGYPPTVNDPKAAAYARSILEK